MKKAIILGVKLANGYLNQIEICEENIKAGNKADYFRGVKKEAEENFCEAVRELAENFSECAAPTLTLQS